MRNPCAPLADLLLGPPGKQRLRLSQTLLSVLTCASFFGVQYIEVRAGLVAGDRAFWQGCYVLGGGALFYMFIRSGLNQRYTSDPSLTLPQALYAMAGVAWGYAITGPARGIIASMMVLIVLFAVFTLDQRRSRILCGVGYALLLAGSAFGVLTGVYDLQVEIAHMGFAALIMASGAILATRMSRMRRRLKEGKQELAEALEQIRLLATRDPLTGLLNRRAMLEVMAAEAGSLRRTGESLAVALIDLDHFKVINDRLGHACGDRVLQAFAEEATAQLREGDVLARWGGEEFLLMLPRTRASQGVCCLQRIREALARRAFGDGETVITPTFSAGVARCRDAADLAAAIERADQAMYRAKTGGRNRSEVDVLAFGEMPGTIPGPAAPHAASQPPPAAPAPATQPLREAV